MSHLDPDQLALLAMGEPVASPTDTDHLADCADCAEELALLRHTAAVGRSAMDAGELEAPPEAVWGRIAEELSLGSAAAAAAQPAVDETRPVGNPGRRRRSRPRRRGLVWALAASFVLVAGIGVGWWALAQPPAVTEIAAAALEPFPDHPDSLGTAVVERDERGGLVVRVSVDGTASPDTYREVWLITSDASALISLGILDGSEGTFAVPAGIDLRDYVLVDISQEPIDGDPGHSGDSIVRGELSPA